MIDTSIGREFPESDVTVPVTVLVDRLVDELTDTVPGDMLELDSVLFVGRVEWEYGIVGVAVCEIFVDASVVKCETPIELNFVCVFVEGESEPIELDEDICGSVCDTDEMLLSGDVRLADVPISVADSVEEVCDNVDKLSTSLVVGILLEIEYTIAEFSVF